MCVDSFYSRWQTAQPVLPELAIKIQPQVKNSRFSVWKVKSNWGKLLCYLNINRSQAEHCDCNKNLFKCISKEKVKICRKSFSSLLGKSSSDLQLKYWLYWNVKVCSFRVCVGTIWPYTNLQWNILKVPLSKLSSSYFP